LEVVIKVVLDVREIKVFSLFDNANAVVRINLERIAFLMSIFESYGLQDRDIVRTAMRERLSLKIPDNGSEVEGRIWGDPRNSNIGISFTCEEGGNSRLVKQFMLTGYGDLANTLIIGTAQYSEKEGVKFTWNVTVESESRSVSKTARLLHEKFWDLPGYRKITFGKFCFLVSPPK
jgi:hypothetical protein